MDSIQWVIDKLGGRLKADNKERRGRNRAGEVERKLKMCPQCDHVWEITLSGVCIRYTHLPTIHLKRIVCTFCKGINKAYKYR